jgi:hypothetical protein
MLKHEEKKAMVRMAVFYDGGYLNEVSNYYKFYHEKQSRISIYGIHSFIRKEVSELEGVDERRVQIVEAHYFRGRFSAEAADQAGKLKAERMFDDVLIRAGVVQHYLPVDERSFKPQEKGIDVWLSLEAFDLAVHKKTETQRHRRPGYPLGLGFPVHHARRVGARDPDLKGADKRGHLPHHDERIHRSGFRKRRRIGRRIVH